jgi:hypothetical protein
MILEDDAKFVLYFKSTLRHLINSMDDKSIHWDLLLVEINSSIDKLIKIFILNQNFKVFGSKDHASQRRKVH